MALATSHASAERPNASVFTSSASSSSLVTLARLACITSDGDTALTRTPNFAASSADERVNAMTPALAAEYADCATWARHPTTDALFTTTPEPRGNMCLNAARVQRNVDVSVTSMMRSHCSSVMSTTSTVPPRPALLTSTSMRPCSAMTRSNSACTLASSVTSHGMPSTPSSSADSAVRRSCLSETTTVAPSSCARLAVAKPMPEPAEAVTSTTRPSSRSWAFGYGGGAGTAVTSSPASALEAGRAPAPR